MSKLNVDKKLIRELAELLEETGLSEVEWESDDTRVRVTRGGVAAQMVAAPAAVPAPAAAAAAAPDESDLSNHPGAVNSPMVGTVYVAPEPGAAPFVQVGDSVTEGQTLLIVEAMKTMNPIIAPRGGRISQILVENAQPVEFGQPLMLIE